MDRGKNPNPIAEDPFSYVNIEKLIHDPVPEAHTTNLMDANRRPNRISTIHQSHNIPSTSHWISEEQITPQCLEIPKSDIVPIESLFPGETSYQQGDDDEALVDYAEFVNSRLDLLKNTLPSVSGLQSFSHREEQNDNRLPIPTHNETFTSDMQEERNQKRARLAREKRALETPEERQMRLEKSRELRERKKRKSTDRGAADSNPIMPEHNLNSEEQTTFPYQRLESMELGDSYVPMELVFNQNSVTEEKCAVKLEEIDPNDQKQLITDLSAFATYYEGNIKLRDVKQECLSESTEFASIVSYMEDGRRGSTDPLMRARAERARYRRAHESEEDREKRLKAHREAIYQKRANLKGEARERYLERHREYVRKRRARLSGEEREKYLATHRRYAREHRAKMTPQEKEEMRKINAERAREKRRNASSDEIRLRNLSNNLYKKEKIAQEAPEQREKRLELDRLRKQRVAQETPEQREKRLEVDRLRNRRYRKDPAIQDRMKENRRKRRIVNKEKQKQLDKEEKLRQREVRRQRYSDMRSQRLDDTATTSTPLNLAPLEQMTFSDMCDDSQGRSMLNGDLLLAATRIKTEMDEFDRS